MNLQPKHQKQPQPHLEPLELVLFDGRAEHLFAGFGEHAFDLLRIGGKGDQQQRVRKGRTALEGVADAAQEAKAVLEAALVEIVEEKG